MRHARVLVIALSAVVLSLRADGGATPAAAPRDLSPLLTQTVKERHVPGMIAAVIAKGRIVAIGAAGVRVAGQPAVITLDDKFHVGSCGKAMTAFLCARLVEKGNLQWDTRLTVMAPNLGKSMHEGFQGVTLEQLLRHRSGLPTRIPDEFWKTPQLEPQPSRRALLRLMLSIPPEDKPGAKYVYSNAGYVAAAVMAENATKKSFEDMMTEQVFQPLGMTSAGFGAPGTPGKVDQPRGHRDDGTPVEPDSFPDNFPAIRSAGIMHMSITDWAKFVSQHLPTPMGKRLLDPRTIEYLQTAAPPTPNNPGEQRYTPGGWMIYEQSGKSFLSHSGSNTYWFATATVYPKDDVAVLVICNSGLKAGAPAVQAVTWALVGEYLDKR